MAYKVATNNLKIATEVKKKPVLLAEKNSRTAHHTGGSSFINAL